MNNIQIGFQTGTSWIARMIRWFERVAGGKGLTNHVAIRYDSDDWRAKWITAADNRGVVAKPEGKRKWTFLVTPKYDATAHLRVIQEYIGQKYDFPSFFLWAFFILMYRWFRVKIRRPHMKSKAQYCSEYAAHLLIAREGLVIENPQWVRPDQLLVLFKAYPDDYRVDKVEAA